MTDGYAFTTVDRAILERAGGTISWGGDRAFHARVSREGALLIVFRCQSDGSYTSMVLPSEDGEVIAHARGRTLEDSIARAMEIISRIASAVAVTSPLVNGVLTEICVEVLRTPFPPRGVQS